MSRPRKPYGPNPPGRLLGTMVKVLAAEMSDQARLARGKRYWTDEAVVDIVVGHGAVTAEIQGSRPQPYVVTIEASAGDGIPGRREVWTQCTCPDDTGTGVDLCKHGVAAFFALADEITIQPELVDRWRASRRPNRADRAPEGADVTELRSPAAAASADDDGGAVDSTEDDVAVDLDAEPDTGRDAEVIELRPRVAAEPDVISPMLRAPEGGAAPSLPDVDVLDHGPIRDRRLAEVLDDALDHLGIRWE